MKMYWDFLFEAIRKAREFEKSEIYDIILREKGSIGH